MGTYRGGESPSARDSASAAELNRNYKPGSMKTRSFASTLSRQRDCPDILVFRLANGIFEPVWNRNTVDHVQITVAEGFRGGDSRPLLRGDRRDARYDPKPRSATPRPCGDGASDVFEANAVRDERAKVLGAIKPLQGPDVDIGVVRGPIHVGLYRRRSGCRATEKRQASRRSLDGGRSSL